MAALTLPVVAFFAIAKVQENGGSGDRDTNAAANISSIAG